MLSRTLRSLRRCEDPWRLEASTLTDAGRGQVVAWTNPCRVRGRRPWKHPICVSDVTRPLRVFPALGLCERLHLREFQCCASEVCIGLQVTESAPPVAQVHEGRLCSHVDVGHSQTLQAGAEVKQCVQGSELTFCCTILSSSCSSLRATFKSGQWWQDMKVISISPHELLPT